MATEGIYSNKIIPLLACARVSSLTANAVKEDTKFKGESVRKEDGKCVVCAPAP